MNWRFTRAGHKVRFERGEPFCHLFPVKHGEVESFEPAYRKLSEEPELERQMEHWKKTRSEVIKGLRKPGATSRDAWQRLYFRGLDAEGQKVESAEHRTRLRVKAFRAVE
jgi:hypothetical protein